MAQLKSTNITGNLAVTGNTLASKIIKLGGTNDDILMGDGSTTSKQALIDSLEAAMERDTNTWREIKVNGTSILGTGIDSGSLNLKAGTNVSISNSGGTVTISSSYTDTDTGATSIEVTGTGNAVTSASYNATTRKITLTKGSTFLTSHQSLAAYVKGPASSTDNAVARFDSTTGKVIQNSRTTIDDTGNLKINNSDGGDIGLTLGRGSNADWRLFGSNGNFHIQGNYTTSKQTSFYSVLTLAYNSGNATVKGSVTANGFKHSNSTTGTNDYVLLAGGGTKSLSDFGTGSGNVSGSGLTTDCIVLGNGSSSIKTSSKTIATSVGTDDTTVPTSKAVKDYVTGLGYITGSYLPLAGGTMTGAIVLPENKMSLKFRTHANYETGIAYGTSGNEALTIALQNPVTAFQIVYGTKPSAYGTATWQSVTPLFQTKDGKVIINRKITATADTSSLKLLDVNGEIGATKLTTTEEIVTSKIIFPQKSNPSIYSSPNVQGVYVDHGVDTPQVRTSAILAPTTSGGTTYGVGTNGQVLKSNGTTVYWGTDNSGSGGLTSLPTRLAEYSTTGYGDANEATTQGWHYMTTNAANRPPFKQSANKDYRIMSTAYSAAWVQQIATDFRGNDMFLRRKENGAWKPWTPIVRFQDCTADHKMQTITDNAIPRWDTGGTAMLQNSTATISDNGHLTINTTSDNTMTTPAINVIHTGPANGTSTADLMILGGYKSAPYGFKFSTYGDGTAIIQSQRISGGSGEKFSLSLNPNGGDVLINGSKAATQAWVEGLGYITGYTLPLAANGTRGGIQIGYTSTENNRAVALSSEKAYISLPTRLYGGRTDSTAPDEALKSGFYYTASLPTSLGFTSNQGTMFVSSYDDSWVAQMVIGCYTNKLAYRKKGTSWSTWATVATEDWVENKGYLTSHQSLSGYVTGTGLTADYLVLGNGDSSIKKGNYRITTDIDSNATNAYIPTAEAVDTFVSGKLSGISSSDKKTSSSSKANTELKLVGAVTASTDGVETFTNPNCYIGTDNCLYSNGKKVATEEWVEAAIKDTISSVSIYSEVLYDAGGSISAAVWTPGWRNDNYNGSWDPAAKYINTAATHTMATVSSSNQTVTLRRPYNSISTHSRWVMEVTTSGMHGLSISGATVTTISNNKYKIQFKEAAKQTITLSKGEATFIIKVVFKTASYQD